MEMSAELAEIHRKLDFLTEEMESQRRHREELNELKDDMLPVANHMIKLSIDELAEIGNDFQLEDLLFLLKRVLRNTHSFHTLLDYMEAAIGGANDFSSLGKEIFSSAVENLDRLERQGYFEFLQGAWYILEKIVAEFSPDDVRALGDNVVTILCTVRSMTQPEILAVANNAVDVMRSEEPDDRAPSTFSLLREFSDPQVRKGLSRMLTLVKSIADQPISGSNNDPNLN
jgi:uncharacterized protein YjgD (DUF1641 family)